MKDTNEIIKEITSPEKNNKKQRKLIYFIATLHFLGGLGIIFDILRSTPSFLRFLEESQVSPYILLGIYATPLVFSSAAIYDGFKVFIRKKTSRLTKILLFTQIPLLNTSLIIYHLYLGAILGVAFNFGSMFDRIKDFKISFPVEFLANYGISILLDINRPGMENTFIIGVNLVPIIILILLKRYHYKNIS